MALRGPIALGLLLLVFVHGGFLSLGQGTLGERGLRGPDSHTRLVQVAELRRSGEWQQATLPRSNTPFGEPRVWSRAFDIVLLAGALALEPAVGFDSALHLWGQLVGPVLHLLTGAALVWAVAPLLGLEALFYLALLLPFQVSITAQFLAGRPDHHALQALLFAALMGLGFRLLGDAARRATVALAALVAAAALWVSIEGLVFVALLFSALGLAWLARGAVTARSGFAFAALLAALTGLVMALERPPEAWLTAEYDRISVVHLCLFLLLAGFWLAALAFERQLRVRPTLGQRLLFAGLGGAVAAGLLWLLYPAFFGGPMVAVPARVLALWQHHIAEFRPAIDPASFANSTYQVLVILGPAVPATLYFPVLAIRATMAARWGWLLLGLGLAVYLPLSLYQLRWGIYAQLLGLPIYACFLQDLLGLVLRPGSGLLRSALTKVVLVLAFAIGPAAAGWLARPAPAQTPTSTVARASVQFCDIGAISAYLMAPSTYGDRPRRLLTFIFDGPEFLYRTHHEVVGTPDHRNVEGISDTLEFFAATDLARARAIVVRRGIELVLFCPAERESRQYLVAGETTLLSRLIEGAPPAWLRPVPLPETLGEDYRLFEVLR